MDRFLPLIGNIKYLLEGINEWRFENQVPGLRFRVLGIFESGSSVVCPCYYTTIT